MEDRKYLVQQCIPMGSFAQYALTTEMRLPVLIATPRRKSEEPHRTRSYNGTFLQFAKL